MTAQAGVRYIIKEAAERQQQLLEPVTYGFMNQTMDNEERVRRQKKLREEEQGGERQQEGGGGREGRERRGGGGG
jgi:hypothetical protein